MPDPAARAVLISVKAHWAEAIARGEKTVELRRRFPDLPRGTRVVVYATIPAAVVLGIAIVERVDRDAPTALWARHADASAVSEDVFGRYFEGCDEGCAVVFSGFRRVGRVPLATIAAQVPNLRAPQSYRYLTERVVDALENEALAG